MQTKNTDDKRKNKPSFKEIREKHKVMVKMCEKKKEYYKKLMADCGALNNRCRTVVDHYQDILKEIEGAGKKLIDPDQEAKEAMEDIAHDVAFTLAMISDHKAYILHNKKRIKIAWQEVLMYERQAEKYRQLLLIKRGRE